MAHPLFQLRGRLPTQRRVLLSIAGAALLLVAWFVLAQALSETLVTQADNVELGSLERSRRLYYDSDSALVADLEELEAYDEAELRTYGLTKRTVYPLLPPPTRVLAAIPEMVREDDLVGNTFYSIQLNALGYLLALAIALPLGFLLGLLPLFRGLFSRVVDAYRFIPLTAVTGIFIMWLGLGAPMKVSFLAFGILVYLVPVVVQRIDEVEDVYLNTVFTLGATDWQTIRTVYVPYVLSRVIDDVRVLTAISWTYITIVEMLNRSGGIGELIWTARRQSRIDKAFAILLIIIAIGLIQDRLFVWLDRWLFPHKRVAVSRA